MAAPVRIEDAAFSDLRYEVLAEICQLADADHARGKMAKLWRQCTVQQSYVLDVAIVVAVLGVHGPDGVVKSGLGEQIEDGIRIRGTKGRIEWLGRLRKNAAKGGRAKSAYRQASGSENPAKNLADACPLTLTPTLTKEREREGTQPAPLALTPQPDAASGRTRERRRGEQIRDDWEPSRSQPNEAAEAEARKRGVDPARELTKLRDWARGKGEVRKDWDAQWRNWLRGARPERPANGSWSQGSMQSGIRKTTIL